jgi:hypothetical protein
METLVDEELMEAQFDHWELLENGTVISFRLTQGKSEYYPARYLNAKNEIKHLELRIDSPASLYVFAKGPTQSHVELYVLDDNQYTLLDTVQDTEFGKIHKTTIKAQRNTVFVFFKMTNPDAGTGRTIDVMTSLSLDRMERKMQSQP